MLLSRFMNAGRRPESCGSETEDFTAHNTAGRLSTVVTSCKKKTCLGSEVNTIFILLDNKQSHCLGRAKHSSEAVY